MGGCVSMGGWWVGGGVWVGVGVGVGTGGCGCGWVCVSDENRTRVARLRGERDNHYATSPQNKKCQKVDIAGNRSRGRLLTRPTR